jgi:hypothetical protein
MEISVYLKRTFAIPQGGIASENCCRPAGGLSLENVDYSITVIGELARQFAKATVCVFVRPAMLGDGR